MVELQVGTYFALTLLLNNFMNIQTRVSNRDFAVYILTSVVFFVSQEV